MARQLKIDEVQEPAWWSAAVYRLNNASGQWRFAGYLEPRWQTWHEYMHRIPMGETQVKTYAFRHTGAAGAKWEQIY